MAAVGGPLQEMSIAGRLFAVAGDAEVNLDLGGFTVEYQPNGNGTARETKTRKVWMSDTVVLSIDPDQGDLEFLQELADTPDGEAPECTFTFVTGVTYGGKGKPTGDIKMNVANSTASLEFSGPGALVQQ